MLEHAAAKQKAMLKAAADAAHAAIKASHGEANTSAALEHAADQAEAMGNHSAAQAQSIVQGASHNASTLLDMLLSSRLRHATVSKQDTAFVRVAGELVLQGVPVTVQLEVAPVQRTVDITGQNGGLKRPVDATAAANVDDVSDMEESLFARPGADGGGGMQARSYHAVETDEGEVFTVDGLEDSQPWHCIVLSAP